jgi:transposase
MRTGRPKAKLVLTPYVRAEVDRLLQDAGPRAAEAERAKIVLLCAGGLDNCEVARRLNISEQTVGRWRARFLSKGVRGLRGGRGRGGRRPLSDRQIDAIVASSLDRDPTGRQALSTRRIAGAVGVSHNSVHRIWRSYGIDPHRESTFDPLEDGMFPGKVWDVVGLYLEPRVHVLVVYVDEQSRLEVVTGKPSPPPRGVRRSADELLAGETVGDALLRSELVDIVARTLWDCRGPYEEAAAYRQFLDGIDETVPNCMDVHLLVNNYVRHHVRQVQDWMVLRPRFRLHLAPTHDSWLDQVDRWFEAAPGEDEYQSGAALDAAAEEFLAERYFLPRPFIWVKSADAINAARARLVTPPVAP